MGAESSIPPIYLDPVALRQLAAAMREGYQAALSEVASDVERGFVLGWKAAFQALDVIADHMEMDEGQ